jgi:uncharacterized protein with PQ loop repeat
MNLHSLGEITLSLSTGIYFIWFIPLIWNNFKRKDTAGLSYWMHGLLLFGYIADLMYGFGQNMEWQYRLVTFLGLISLGIQHAQIIRYGLHSRQDAINILIISILAVGLLIYAGFNIFIIQRSLAFYNMTGFISTLCWFSYMLPQIIKNFIRQSTAGLSVSFVVLSILISLLDITSTITLKWAWPSLLESPLTLVKKLTLLAQVYYYDRKYMKRLIL